MDELDKEVRQFVEDNGFYNCHQIGLAGLMNAFYCSIPIEQSNLISVSADEVANDLGLSRKEFEYWEDLYYKKTSWFNNEEN